MVFFGSNKTPILFKFITDYFLIATWYFILCSPLYHYRRHIFRVCGFSYMLLLLLFGWCVRLSFVSSGWLSFHSMCDVQRERDTYHNIQMTWAQNYMEWKYVNAFSHRIIVCWIDVYALELCAIVISISSPAFQCLQASNSFGFRIVQWNVYLYRETTYAPLFTLRMHSITQYSLILMVNL